MESSTVGRKKPSKKVAAPAAEAALDPREDLPQTKESRSLVLKELEAVLADLEPQPEPAPQDYVEAMLHIGFAEGLPCGYGQEARRRIAESFVDRNEFRVTEAFEVEELLSDLSIPDLFDRCLMIREAVGQIYNDQNGVRLDFLSEASISERNSFFQRIPALKPEVVSFLGNLLFAEELCFSDRSTLRVQQRMGLDPKDAEDAAFVESVRALLRPFGHLPLEVGKHLPSGRPNLSHPLSPACNLTRLLPGRKRR
ncbi:MAG: hypothetical protein Fur0037_15250 [Planctomycetota bacterium]